MLSSFLSTAEQMKSSRSLQIHVDLNSVVSWQYKQLVETLRTQMEREHSQSNDENIPSSEMNFHEDRISMQLEGTTFTKWAMQVYTQDFCYRY